MTQDDVGDIYVLNAGKRHDLGGLTNAGGWPMVSESQKTLMEQFDVGHSLFHPVRILDLTKTFPTTIEPYYLLNVCNHKDTPDLDAIFEMEKPAFEDLSADFGRPFYFYGYTAKDWFKAKPETLDGPDIWIDPLIHESTFLSDRLVRAITLASFAKDWELVRC